MLSIQRLRAHIQRLRRDNWLRARINRLMPRGPKAAAAATLFVHIPKTGGVSLTRFLVGKLRARNPIAIVSQKQLTFMSDDELCGYDFVSAHTNATIMRRMPGCHKLTLLREPVARVVSSYYFHRNDARDMKLTRLAKELDLRRFVMSKDPAVAGSIENAQARQLMLNTPDDLNLRAQLSDADVLARARASLDAMDVVGCIETIDDMLRRLKDHYGWRSVGSFPHLNKTRGETPCPPDIADIIRSRTKLDRELYDDVRDRFG